MKKEDHNYSVIALKNKNRNCQLRLSARGSGKQIQCQHKEDFSNREDHKRKGEGERATSQGYESPKWNKDNSMRDYTKVT